MKSWGESYKKTENTEKIEIVIKINWAKGYRPRIEFLKKGLKCKNWFAFHFHIICISFQWNHLQRSSGWNKAATQVTSKWILHIWV